jgi:hypothetical protein
LKKKKNPTVAGGWIQYRTVVKDPRIQQFGDWQTVTMTTGTVSSSWAPSIYKHFNWLTVLYLPLAAVHINSIAGEKKQKQKKKTREIESLIVFLDSAFVCTRAHSWVYSVMATCQATRFYPKLCWINKGDGLARPSPEHRHSTVTVSSVCV